MQTSFWQELRQTIKRTSLVVTSSALMLSQLVSPTGADPAANAASFSRTTPGAIATTVPDGTCGAVISAMGGGGGSSGGAGGSGGQGGASALIKATFKVLPLQAVTGTSAQGGQFNNGTLATTIAAGGTGFAAGGNGGALPAGNSHRGAGGGGSTNVGVGGTTLMIAGGGGGGGAAHSSAPVGNGGNAGFTGIVAGGVVAGANGSNGAGGATETVNGGGAGTAAAGGAGGANGTLNGFSGGGIGVGTGGNGGADPNNDSGGGGGAGYTGGGGGASTVSSGSPNTGGGGGGGSSFLAGSSPVATGNAPTAVSGAIGSQAAGGVAALGPNGSVSIDWIPCAYNLAVTKTVSPTTVKAGEKVVWTVTVTNNGPDPMTRGDTLSLADTLPPTVPASANPQFVVTSIATAGGSDPLLARTAFSCTGVTVGSAMPASTVCTRPYDASTSAGAPSGGTRGLDSGETLTITYEQVIPNKETCRAITNTASTVDRASLSGTTDIIGVTGAKSAAAPLTISCYDLGINKTVAPPTPGNGDVVTWSVAVTNNSSIDMEGPVETGTNPLIVTDTAPTGSVTAPTAFTSTGPAGACTYSAGTITCPQGLPAGQTQNFTFQQTISGNPAGGTVINNTASLTDPATGDTNDSSTISATVSSQPRIRVVKTASAVVDLDSNGHDVGDRINYSFVVTNTGNLALTSVGVTDAKVGAVSCPVTSLIAGASTTCTAAYTLTLADMNAGNVTNTATASGTPPTGPAVTDISGSDTTNDTPTVAPLTQTPRLSVDKTSSTLNFNAVNSTINYSYLVTNTGNVSITNPIAVADNKTTVSCPALPPAGLAPGGTITCLASYAAQQADIDAGGVTNTATANTTFGPGNTPVASPSDQVTVPSIRNRSMSVVKNATSVAFVNIGDLVTYEYIVRNTGNTTLTVPITVSDNRVSPVTCPALPPGGLAPNATLTCTATYALVLADLDLGSVTNIATATDGTTTSPQTSETVPAGVNPALTINKTKAATTPTFNALGDTVTYNFLVTNSGNATLTRLINVTDDKIGTIACWTPSGADPTFIPGETATCSASYTVTQADLDRGFVTNQAFAATTFGGTNIPVTSPPDSETANAIQNPELTVTKGVATLPVAAAGQVLTYTIITQNTGDVTLSNVTTTDPLIPSLSCTVATLNVGASTSCVGTHTVTQAEFDAGRINNTARSAGATPQGAPVSDTGSLTTLTSPANPALTIDKVATPANFAAVGNTISYAFSVTNTGNVTLTNVRVTDPLVPAFNCVIPSLAPGAINGSCATSYVVKQSDIDAGKIDNTATVTAVAARGTNPTATDTATATGPTRAPAVTITKTASPDTYSAVGDAISYEYVVTNTGNISLTGAVSISDDKITSVSCPALPVAGLPPGGIVVCSATHVVTQANLNDGSLVNTARANTNTILGPLTSAPVSETATAVQTPRISLIKTAGTITDVDGNGPDAGDTIAYSFTVKNEGNVTLTSVGVTDAKVGAVTCVANALIPGASTTCSATYALTQADVDAGLVTNTAVASGTPPTGPAVTDSSGSAADNNTPTVVPVTRTPLIAVVKTAGGVNDLDGNGADPGDTINYTFTVSNEGNVTLSSIGVTDPKISGVTCPVTVLAPKTSTICAAVYTLTQADVNGGQVINTATASGTSPSGVVVTDQSGNTISDNTPTVTPISQTPAIAIVKSASAIADVDANGPDAGDRITYSFVVSNQGNVTLSSVAVSDPKVGPVSCPVSVLAPAETTSCQVTYVLTQADVNSGGVTNSATATGRTPSNASISDVSGADIFGNTPTVSNIPQSPSLTIDKTSPTVSFNAVNNVLTYSYLVTNAGNVTITAPITVTDDRTTVSCPALPPGGLLPTQTLTCSATYLAQQADIDAGNVTNTASAHSTFGPGNTAVDSPTDMQIVPAVQNPGMTLTKTPTTVNFINVGDRVDYDFVIANTGNTTLNGPFAISDSKIGAISCPNANIAPGATLTCNASYYLLVEDLDLGSVTNLAMATNGSTNTPQTSATVPAGATPALSIAKTANTLNFDAVNDLVSYTFVVRNSGGSTFTRAIDVTDDRIGLLNCWTPAAGDPTFIPGETATCTANYSATQADLDRGFVANQAFASTTYGAANIAVTSPQANATVPAVQTPSLDVTKSVATLPIASVNQILTYTIATTNNGNVTLSNVLVTDPLIPSLSCTIATLPVGSSQNCSGTYTVKQSDFDAGKIDNTATARGITPQGNAVTDTGLASTPITQTPSIALVKSASNINDLDGNGPDAGDQIVYSFVVSNEGNVTLNAVAISDPKVGPVSCPVTTIAPGLSVTCQSTYTLQLGDVNTGSVVNTATVTSKAPSGADVTDISGSNINNDTNTVTAIPSVPRITLVKSVSTITDLDGNGPDVGDTVKYTFDVANAGNQTLTNVSIVDNLFVPSTFTCGATTLQPAATTTCDLTYVLKQSDIDAAQITNTATARGTSPGNSVVSDVSGSTSGNDIPTVRPIPTTASLAVRKIAGTISDPDGNGVDAGDTVSYSFEVQNTGNLTLQNVTVSDAKAVMAGGPIATLLPAAVDTTTFTATYVLTQQDVDSGNIRNTAVARGNPPTGPPVTDTSGTGFGDDTPTDKTLPSNPAITLVKNSLGITDLDGNGPDVGDTVNYTFVVINRGNVTLSNVAINDPLVGLASLEGQESASTLLAMAATDVDPLATASTSQLAQPLPDNTAPSLTTRFVESVFGSGPGVPEIPTALHVTRHLVRLNEETRPLAAGDKVGIYFSVVNTGDGALTFINAEQDQSELIGSGLTILPANTSAMMPSIFVHTISEQDVAIGKVTSSARISFKSRDVPLSQEITGSLALADVQTSNDMLTASISPAVISSLAPGASSTFNGSYTLKQSDVDAGGVDNTAVAAGRAPNGTSVSDTSGSAETNDTPTSTAIVRTPKIALVKSAADISDRDGNGPDAGDTILYSFDISNEGNVTLSALGITDPKIGTVSCPQTSVLPASTVTCTANYVLTQADVDTGEVVNTAVVNGTAPGNTPVQDRSGGTINDDTPTVKPVPRNAAVTLVKTAGAPTTAQGADATFTDAGDAIVYTFTLRNTGNVTLTPLAVTDTKISSVSCPVNVLAPAESTDCLGTYTLTQSDFDFGSVENTAIGTGAGPDGTTALDTSGTDATNDTPTTTPLNQLLQLTLVKTAAAPTTSSGANGTLVDAGDTIDYTFEVRNTGNVTLNNLSISDDKVPSVSCPLSTLAPTATTSCTGTYTLTQADLDAGKVINTATAETTAPNGVTASDVSGTDSGNDTPTETPLPQVPLIAVVKTAAPFIDVDGNGVDEGDTIQYSFVVTNQGNVTLAAVAINDPKVGTVACPATVVLPAATITCTATYTLVQADLDAGQVENQATVTGTPPTGTPVTDLSDSQTPGQGPGENDKTVTPLTQNPRIALVKTADLTGLAQPAPKPGNKIKYIFTVTNTGNVTLKNITLADHLPNLQLTSGPIEELAPGKSNDKTFIGTYAITTDDISRGYVENTAITTGNYQDATGNPLSVSDTSGTAADNNSPTRVPLKAVPKIAVEKTGAFKDISAPKGANVGDTISYAFVISNLGNVVLNNVSLSDPMLTGVTCKASTLNVGEETTCTADDYVLTQEDINKGEVRNQAIARGDAIVDGAVQAVSDESGSGANSDDPTVTGLPEVVPNFTKTANKSIVRIGDLVTFTIRATDVVIVPVNIVDQLPGGLSYVPGSAKLIDGTPTAGIDPITASGRKIFFNSIRPTNFTVTVVLQARVNASADGKITNRAQLLRGNGALLAEARATVEVRPDPVFDCGDVIGKVFDDANGNGVQDAETSPYTPERGIPGVRVATVNGQLITTDKNGKFHIPCADIPNVKIGSNFILKLDPRSLPSGYRMTTENPRVVRLTRGKLTKINFGATISRVIRIDLTDKVFTSGGVAVTPKLKAAILDVIEILDQDQSILRLQYHLGSEGKAIAQRRLKLISDFIASRWEERSGRYKLPIETRLLHSQQGAAE